MSKQKHKSKLLHSEGACSVYPADLFYHRSDFSDLPFFGLSLFDWRGVGMPNFVGPLKDTTPQKLEEELMN